MARKLTEKEYAQKIINLGYTYISGYERSTSKCKLICPKKFAKQNLHDDMKRDYTKSPGYNLLEMPYTANTQEKVDEYLADYLVSLEEKVGGIDGR